MVQTRTRSFPTGLKMDSTFDIFKRLPDGNITRRFEGWHKRGDGSTAWPNKIRAAI